MAFRFILNSCCCCSCCGCIVNFVCGGDIVVDLGDFGVSGNGVSGNVDVDVDANCDIASIFVC